MSRCFPFPPSGYEKTRTVDTDMLEKEKQKEKKHKKEKKDKVRKDKKERKDKNRSEEKQRDKKRKKEKHREKKKDKEKERDKHTDKTNAVAEKRSLVQNEGPNADTPTQKEHKHKDKSSISLEEKFSWQHAGYNGEKIRQSSHLVEEIKDHKFNQEFDRRIKHDAGGGTQMVHKFPIMDHGNDEATSKVFVMVHSRLPDSKEKVKGVDNRKSDGHGSLVDALPIGNAMVQNHVGKSQPICYSILINYIMQLHTSDTAQQVHSWTFHPCIEGHKGMGAFQVLFIVCDATKCKGAVDAALLWLPARNSFELEAFVKAIWRGCIEEVHFENVIFFDFISIIFLGGGLG